MGDTHPRHHMGDTHPRHQVEHEHDEKVCNLDCTAWIKEWYKWLFAKPYDSNPLYITGEDRGAVEPEEEGQGNNIKCSNGEESVWFLTPPMFSYSSSATIIKHVNLPLGKWHFLASPYNCHASRELFPSLTSDQDLFQIAKRDVDSVYQLEMTLDGRNLGGCRVPIEKSFAIKLPLEHNILGLRSNELQKGNVMNIVSDGYWIFLGELSPGDHILTLKGYSPVYKLDVEFRLYVRGPRR